MRETWSIGDRGAYVRFGSGALYSEGALTVYEGESEPYESTVEITPDVARRLISALEKFLSDQP